MKIFRTVGILSVILLFVSAYLPWVNLFKNDVYQTSISGMNTIHTGYKPALVALIFSVLYLITIFIHKLWVKIAGVFFAVVIIAWTIKNFFYLPPNAPKLLSAEAFTQYTTTKAVGIYLTLLAALGILVAAVTPYFPDKYRKD